MAVDRALVDTNVLLTATDAKRDDHEAARSVLDKWPAAGAVLYTSGQVLREYLVVATRPTDVNGLGLAIESARANVEAFRTRLSVLDETDAVGVRLLDLLTETACTGKQIHDAAVVATMLVHGVDTIVTANTKHFQRFADLVRVLPLGGGNPSSAVAPSR